MRYFFLLFFGGNSNHLTSTPCYHERNMFDHLKVTRSWPGVKGQVSDGNHGSYAEMIPSTIPYTPLTISFTPVLLSLSFLFPICPCLHYSLYNFYSKPFCLVHNNFYTNIDIKQKLLAQTLIYIKSVIFTKLHKSMILSMQHV